ncbi:histidine kinase [Herbidospora sp. NBRC 101105]|uniref:sensor histidine kinase n=1 Tax=Herbidospora sp. NBRC 101105 TaxID=3032195 RepID=UPI0024A011F0|nr:histidine kinase [Herbidospora sp. NBRC 101105]GLX92467.1 two-component sensor histidine kinase [Herbidospora sp. NBRC 101105]
MALRIPAPSRSDLLIGAAVAAVGILEAFTSATSYGAAQNPELWWIPQALIAGAVLCFRRTSPVIVFVATVVIQFLWHRQGYEMCQVHQQIALLIAFHSLGAHLSWKRGAVWGLGGIFVFDIGAVDMRPLPVDEIIFLTVLFGFAYLTGVGLRAWLVRAQKAARQAALAEVERERRAAEAVAAERSRIARELHDVVAHSVSMMVMQAAALRRAQGGENPVLAGIEQSGRDAVNELRVMLGALRMPQDEALPQPGLDMVRNLISTVSNTALRVTLTVTGEPVRLAPGLDLSAYRIVQEALTNAVKYAGEADVQIKITYHPLSVTLEVTDNGKAAGAAGLSTGNGLIGMRERAELFGGTLDAGPREEGGFRVCAVLPTSPGVVLV